MFCRYRIIRCAGPVNTLILSLHVNALAAFCTPAIAFLPPNAPSIFSTFFVSMAYILVAGDKACALSCIPNAALTICSCDAASRNMGFAVAIMLSKESAPGAPGVAIGINQSACSLGSAVGPIMCGLGYTQSLWWLKTSVPFFLSLGVLGLTPGIGTQLIVPRWPWAS